MRQAFLLDSRLCGFNSPLRTLIAKTTPIDALVRELVAGRVSHVWVNR